MPLETLDMVNELCDPIKHHEHYQISKMRGGRITWYGRDHWTWHPALIAQLSGSLSPTGDPSEGKPAHISQPAARLEAVDAARRIDLAAAGWVRRLGRDDPGDAAHNVRLAYSLAPASRDLAADIRSWWTQARILTGWDVAAWQPDNTCPLCAGRGTLRVKFAIESATCVACSAIWGPRTIGILAAAIRAESDGGGNGVWAMPLGKPCHCQVCDPRYDRWRLCPVCGSRRCVKTIDHRYACSRNAPDRTLPMLTTEALITHDGA